MPRWVRNNRRHFSGTEQLRYEGIAVHAGEACGRTTPEGKVFVP